MDDEAKREGAATPEGLAEKALSGKSAGKTVALSVLTIVFIAILGIHFYSSRAVDPQATAPREQAPGNSPVYPDSGADKGKLDSSYANLDTLLPLKEGRSWEFTNVRTKNGRTRELRNVVTSLGVREIRGRKVNSLRYDIERTRLSSNKKVVVYLFYGIDHNSIYILAKQTEKDVEPRVARVPIYVLKNPIKVGTSWKNRVNEGVIESVNETVTVPAGTFNGCIRVKLTFRKSVSINWIAPGIGYVKKIFQYQNGGEALEQLVSYKK